MLEDGPKTFTKVPKDANKPSFAAALQFQRTEDSDEKGCTSAPEYRQSFNEAIQAALDASTSQETSNSEEDDQETEQDSRCSSSCSEKTQYFLPQDTVL
ncbi:hypothetical protein TNCV_5029951 [Trichonephila clavipes]|nr:hypothetical protein TNCV_5029951 [Trichonephila clavipes]